jgi:hypothetical protein
MPVQIRPDDPNLTWQGAISFQRTDDWTMPWRLPYENLGLFPSTLSNGSPSDMLRERAAMPAGVRISFRSDTQTIAGYVDATEESTGIDLYCDGRFHGWADLSGQESFQFEALPPGDKLIELWLPQIGEFRLRSLELSPGAAIAAYEDTRPKWITYGSSISHCRAAERPSETWPAIVARDQGLNMTCLGYGGQCQLDTMVARMIRELPADFLSMKVGINSYESGSFNPRSFAPAIIGFVYIVREKHPDTPFAVVSPIVSPPRESIRNSVGFTLEAMREEVAGAVQALKAHGDRNIHYFDGLDLFGPEYAHMLPDQLHPDAQGYKLLGQNFSRKVADTVFVQARS